MAEGASVMLATTIDPGQLRTEFSLEQATPVADGMGGHVEQWDEIATLFGRIEPVTAGVRFGAGQALETLTHRVTIRRRDGILSGMRLGKGARRFAIVSIHDPDESGRYLVLRTREEGA